MIAEAAGGEYAGGALVSAGGGRLVAVVVVNGLAEATLLPGVVVAEGARLMALKDAVLLGAEVEFVFDSLVEPNFLKKEGILDGGE